MLDEAFKKGIERNLTLFCDARVPLMVRDKVVLQFRFEAQTVVLFEKRPHFARAGEWTESPIARFRYVKSRKRWTLQYRDRNCRWHRYDPLPESESFDELLDEIDTDPTGIFWG